MKITILTVGTRGDVQPYLALALGLHGVGHEVTLATGSNFESFVTSHGVPFAPLRADYFQLVDSPEGKAVLSGNPLRAWQKLKNEVLPLVRYVLEDSWTAARNSDAIIYHPKVLSGAHIAERLGVPCVIAATVPVLTPTSAFPAPGLTTWNLGGPLNKLTYGAISAASRPFGQMIKEWRSETLGLPSTSKTDTIRLNGTPLPVMYCYSPLLVPSPADWNEHTVATGFWFLPPSSTWEPPRDLVAFLEVGPPPVYIGFGSMASTDPARTTEIVVEALQQAGQRGIIATGWGGLSATDLPSSIFATDTVPHDWLFPKVAAVVHHGGAGTVAAGLREGKPTVICPFFADQPFWGHAVWKAGVGPQAIPQKALTADRLAVAIRAVTTDAAMQQRAAALGAAIRAEDGVGEAIQFFNRYVSPESSPTALPQSSH